MQVQFRAPGRAFSLVWNARLGFVSAAVLISASGLVIARFPGLIGHSQADRHFIACWGVMVAIINAVLALHVAVSIPSLIADLFSANEDLRSYAERSLSSPHSMSIYLVYNPLVVVLIGGLMVGIVARTLN